MAEIVNILVDNNLSEEVLLLLNPVVSKVLLISLDPLVDLSALNPSDSFSTN